MKKVLAILLSVLTVFSCVALASCSGTNENPTQAPDSKESVTSAPVSEKPTEGGKTEAPTGESQPVSGGETTTEPPTGEEPPSEAVVDPNKKVSKCEIVKEPDKTFYEVGETFTVAGGVVKVTYDDGTTQELPMSSASFEVATPSMSAVGTKNINVKYNGKKFGTFTVKVANKSFEITYNLNYEGAPAPETVSVVKGQKAENRKPTREGYTFVTWYANADYIYEYDFGKGVQEPAEIFAFWKKDGASYVDVTFDHGYYGDLYEKYTYPVESGAKVSKPSDPMRTGYKFDKWVDASGAAYDFTKPVAEATTIRATWTKTVSGRQTYVFEAEDTSLKGKVGPAFSGTCSEEAMIVPAPANRGCSNDRFVSFLYRIENSLEFYIAVDEEVKDATIYARLSAELRDYTFDPSNYAIELNDVPLNYKAIAFVNVPFNDDPASALDCLPFEDYVIATNVTLKKGANLIRLITKNSVPMDGTTLEAAAPIVDCVKVETTGVVTWDANRGVPAKNY